MLLLLNNIVRLFALTYTIKTELIIFDSGLMSEVNALKIFGTRLVNMDLTWTLEKHIDLFCVCRLCNVECAGSASLNAVVVHGCRDLFWLPIEQYRRDGRIVRGFQRGAQSFMTCTAMSTLELTNRVVQTIQVTTVLVYFMTFYCHLLLLLISDGTS